MPTANAVLSDKEVARRAEQSRKMKERWATKRQNESGAPIIGVPPAERAAPQVVATQALPHKPSGNKWEDMPLADAIAELGKLQSELDKARQIVFRRQQFTPLVHKCWVAACYKDGKRNNEIRGIELAYKQCRRDIPDGKWIFRDDSPKNPETGLIESVLCCSLICTQTYQAHRQRVKQEGLK